MSKFKLKRVGLIHFHMTSMKLKCVMHRTLGRGFEYGGCRIFAPLFTHLDVIGSKRGHTPRLTSTSYTE